MGNIIDLTILVENFRNKKAYMNSLLTKKLGDSVCVLNSYIVPQNGTITDYDNFKNWFLEIWNVKDTLLNNMYTLTDTRSYAKLSIKSPIYEYMLAFVITSIFIYLIIKTKGIYLICSLAITYIITLYKYKLLKK